MTVFILKALKNCHNWSGNRRSSISNIIALKNKILSETDINSMIDGTPVLILGVICYLRLILVLVPKQSSVIVVKAILINN